MTIPRSLRRAIPAALAALALAVVVGRLLLAARQAITAAEAARARGDLVEAAQSYLDALRCYVPGSPFESRALDGLEAIAADAARSGDVDGERRALEALRRGLLATRSLFMPYRTRFAAAGRRLSDLDARQVFPPVTTPPIIRPPLHGWGPPAAGMGPAVTGTLMALGGFATWVGAVVLTIRRGMTRDIAPRGPGMRGAAPGVVVSVLFVIGFALFLVGLRFA